MNNMARSKKTNKKPFTSDDLSRTEKLITSLLDQKPSVSIFDDLNALDSVLEQKPTEDLFATEDDADLDRIFEEDSDDDDTPTPEGENTEPAKSSIDILADMCSLFDQLNEDDKRDFVYNIGAHSRELTEINKIRDNLATRNYYIIYKDNCGSIVGISEYYGGYILIANLVTGETRILNVFNGLVSTIPDEFYSPSTLEGRLFEDALSAEYLLNAYLKHPKGFDSFEKFMEYFNEEVESCERIVAEVCPSFKIYHHGEPYMLYLCEGNTIAVQHAFTNETHYASLLDGDIYVRTNVPVCNTAINGNAGRSAFETCKDIKNKFGI